jgi:hypothetical protein
MFGEVNIQHLMESRQLSLPVHLAFFLYKMSLMNV